MEYKVLYRKYRPVNFEEIVGQDYIINILKKAIVNNKISHAYLFSGPRGTGKTSTAKVFAKAVNCTNNSSGEPCNKCSSCIEFDRNPDIIEIDAASNNGVDEIRELRNNIKLVPALSKYKIYIIDEVHMLSIGAFNALLKTLEEPPAHVIFILATTDVQKIPITVISRCQRFDFHQLSTEIISNYLAKICDNENIKFDHEALDEIAYLSDGAMRDALGILDQIISSIDGKLSVEEVEKVIKTVSNQKLEELYQALESNNAEIISSIVNEVEKNGYDFTYFVNKLVKFLRIKALSVKKETNFSKINFTKIKDLIFSLNKILSDSKTEISPFLLMEMELLDNIDVSLKKETLIKHNEEEKPKETIKKKTKPTVEKFSKEIRVNNCFVGANKDFLNQNKKAWANFIEEEKEKNYKIYNNIVDTKVVVASNKYLILACNSEGQSVLFNKNNEKISQEYLKYCNEDYKPVLLTEEEWQNYKAKYIEAKKNNKKYELIEEKPCKAKNLAESKIGKIAYKIFDEKNIKME